MGKRSTLAAPFKTAVERVKRRSKGENGIPKSAITAGRKPLPCPPNLDPLVQKAYHNLAVSPLTRIPDELLLLIMAHLPPVDLASLRQTCRIFLRLHRNVRFSPPNHPAVPGPWLRMGYLNVLSVADLRGRLLADKYCTPCWEKRVLRRNSAIALKQALCRAHLWCGGCGGAHSAGLFSPWERGVSDPIRRVCIAHEGHLRVCQHRVITWTDLQRWSAFLGGDTRSHKVVVCGAQSHLSQCGTQNGRTEPGVVVKLQATETGQIRVSVDWRVHISVPHRKGSTSTYDADDLRKIAEGLYADAGQHIVPRFQPDQPPHMAAFDPNFCGCLTYAGRGLLDWQMAPEPSIRDCCRKSKSRALFTSRAALRSKLGVLWSEHEAHVATYGVGQQLKSRFYRITFKRCCAEPGSMGVVVSHRHSFMLTCGPARWPPNPEAPNYVPPEWYRVMDRASYGLEGDKASRHFLWCEDKGCANHISQVVGVDRFRDMVSLKGIWF